MDYVFIQRLAKRTNPGARRWDGANGAVYLAQLQPSGLGIIAG
jgi:hypothetical protein